MIKKILPLLFTAALLFPSWTTAAEDWSPVVKRVMPAVVSLRIYDKQGMMVPIGTGFSIGENRIVTCWHCVDSESIDQMVAVTESGDSRIITHVINASVENDVVILQHDGEQLPAAEMANVENDKGSPVLVIGSPLGYEFTVSDGVTSSWRKNPKKNGREELQYTAPTSPGNSGGPVFNTNGHVVGVVSYFRTNTEDQQAQNINFAISFKHIQELLGSAKKILPLVFSDRFTKYTADKEATEEIIKSFYKHIAVDYLYEREYIRLTQIESLDKIIADVKQARQDAEEREVRNLLTERLGELTKLQREYTLRRVIDEPLIVPTGGDPGAVGELYTGSSNASFLLQEVLSSTDAILTVNTDQGQSVPFIVHRLSVENVVVGDTVIIPGVYYFHGVEVFEASDSRRLRLRAYSLLNTELLHATVRTMDPGAREAIEKRALQDYRRDTR